MQSASYHGRSGVSAPLVMVIALLAIVAASSGVPWVEYATFGLVGATAFVAAVGWVAARFFSHRLRYTDQTLHPDAERCRETVLVDVPSFVFVKIRARRAVDFREIQVRPQERRWRPKWTGFGFRREFGRTPKEAFELSAVEDWFLGGSEKSGLPSRFSTAALDDDRAAIVCTFSPVWTRLGDDSVALRLSVHAHRKWKGFLAFSLPSASGRRYWTRIRIRTR